MKLTALILGMLIGSSAHAADPTVEELLDATDDITRGESSIATVTMDVKTKRYERSVTIKAWTKGTEKSLMQILEPAKEKGTATLKVDDNIWNYLPKVDRTIKIPSSMMGGSWMGSHFTNDDLVKENRLREEFTYELTSKPADNPDKQYVIELIPKPDAPVVWGKVVVRISEDELPVDITYYDEKDNVARTMTFSDVQDFSGRKVPKTMLIVPGDKPDEFTRVTYVDIEFDVELGDDTFTLQALKR